MVVAALRSPLPECEVNHEGSLAALIDGMAAVDGGVQPLPEDRERFGSCYEALDNGVLTAVDITSNSLLPT